MSESRTGDTQGPPGSTDVTGSPDLAPGPEGAPGPEAEGEAGSGGSRPIVLLLSGANLNLFGQRDPDVYGTDTLEDFVGRARTAAERHGLVLEHLQSNSEGHLVDAIHRARGRAAAIIVNPGAFGHYAWSLHDALAAFDGPVVELHVSNPDAREPWRHTSVIAPVADGTVAGFKGHGYELAVEAVARLLA